MVSREPRGYHGNKAAQGPHHATAAEGPRSCTRQWLPESPGACWLSERVGALPGLVRMCIGEVSPAPTCTFYMYHSSQNQAQTNLNQVGENALRG